MVYRKRVLMKGTREKLDLTKEKYDKFNKALKLVKDDEKADFVLWTLIVA